MRKMNWDPVTEALWLRILVQPCPTYIQESPVGWRRLGFEIVRPKVLTKTLLRNLEAVEIQA